MADQPKSDAMKAAEAKGMQTGSQGGKNPVVPTPPQSSQGPRREASQPPTGRSSILSDAVSKGQQQPASTVPGSAVGHDANQGADRVTASRSADIPTAQGLGFHSLSLYDLQNIYASLRDGNYFQAMKQAVLTLNSLLNPDATAGITGPNRVTPGAMRPPRAAAPFAFDEQGKQAFTETYDRLKQWVGHAQSQPQMTLGHGAERIPPHVGAISIGNLAGIIQLVLQLIEQFRQNPPSQ